MSAQTPPPFDPELAAYLEAVAGMMPASVTLENIDLFRTARADSVDDLIAGRDIVAEDHTIKGPGGELILTSFRRADHTAPGAGVYFIHGGGMILGNRFGGGMPAAIDWVERMDAVAVSVEYRLAPEHPDPAPVEDSYAGLVWAAANAAALGFDPARLIVAGASAGGGLAAGVTLMSRDRGGPHIFGQVLIYPMLDDRNDTVSAHQMNGIGVWDRNSNDTGWSALLGDRRGRDDVSIYAVPARATDLSRLPPTYIDCVSAEVFRDEDIAYAQKIWAAGGICELHVWPGGFHGSDFFAPEARLSKLLRETRTAWVERLLSS
jgi:acetyl esterase/lipase